MNQSIQDEETRVVDLGAYRTHKEDDGGLHLPNDRQEAEALLNDLVHHLLMAIRTITTRCR